MILPVFGGRHACSTALTSEHRDGSVVASILRYRKITTIRGSTRRIGTAAIRKMLDTVASRHLVITPDGPRGPNRVMSPGIAYLASRTSRAVVPTGFACSRCWRWKGSWSELIIPIPFSTVVMLTGTPIYVPSEVSRTELVKYVERIQDVMEQLDHLAITKIEEITHRSPSSFVPLEKTSKEPSSSEL